MSIQEIADDMYLLQKTRRIPSYKKVKQSDPNYESVEMQRLSTISQKNENILEMLRMNAQIVTSDMNISQINLEMLSQKSAYELLIKEFQQKDQRSSQIILDKDNEIKTLKREIIKLNESHNRLKKESITNVKSRDQKIKAFQMVEKNYKDRFNQDKSSMQNKINDLTKTIIKMKSDFANVSTELENKAKLVLHLKEENAGKYMELASLTRILEKYQQAETEIIILKSKISTLESEAEILDNKVMFCNQDNFRLLEKENSELKRSSSQTKSSLEKSYLLVSEMENLRQKLDRCQKICTQDYPHLQNLVESYEREIGEWEGVTEAFLTRNKDSPPPRPDTGDAPGDSDVRDQVQSVPTPNALHGILEGLDKRHHMLTTENESLKRRIQTSRDDLEKCNRLVSDLRVEVARYGTLNQSLTTNSRSLGIKLTTLKPKSDKLKHYLEYRSIIPNGHSEHQNFRETFAALQDLFTHQFPKMKGEPKNQPTREIITTLPN